MYFNIFNLSLFNFQMEFKILQRLRPKSIWLPIALEIGRCKAEAMLILFSVQLPNVVTSTDLEPLVNGTDLDPDPSII